MKKLVPLKNLFLLLLLISPALGLAQSLPIKIMPLGNSITFDTYSNDQRNIAEKRSYRLRLYDLLKTNNYTPGTTFDFVGSQQSGPTTNFDADHQGTPGVTTATVASNIYNQLVVNPADIVLLHLGTNDVAGNISTTAAVANTEIILNKIDEFEAATNRSITVIIARIINQQPYDAKTTAFNDELEAMVNIRLSSNTPDQLVLIDMENGAGINYQTDMYDYLHPNVAGYTKMGDLWYAALKPVLDNKIRLAQGAPVITSVPVTGARIGETYTYKIDVTGTAPITYALVDAPVGMAINASTGLITFEPTEARAYNVSATASNGIGEIAKQDFVLTVLDTQDCPDGLQQYYKLDEAAGATVFADSFNGNNGSPSANPPTPVDGGIVGKAQSFNGVDNYIVINDDPTFDWGPDASFTIEVWSKFTDVSGQDNKVMIGRDQFSLKPHWWVGARVETGKANFTLLEDGTSRGVSTISTTSINDDKWHHIVAVRDNSTNMNRIYVDGVEEGAETYDYTIGFNATTTIGLGYMAFNNSPRYFYNGLLDEVAIHNRALTPEEIRSSYTKTKAGVEKCAAFNPVTSIPEDLENNGLMIYPVPVQDQLNILFDKRHTETLSVTIVDRLGRIAFQKEIFLLGQQDKLSILLTDEKLAPGIYLLRVSSAKFSEGKTIRFIKN